MQFIMSFPVWFWMILIAVIVGAVGYRLVRFGIKIKAGPVEIDATEDDPKEPSPVEGEK